MFVYDTKQRAHDAMRTCWIRCTTSGRERAAVVTDNNESSKDEENPSSQIDISRPPAALVPFFVRNTTHRSLLFFVAPLPLVSGM